MYKDEKDEKDNSCEQDGVNLHNSFFNPLEYL